MSDKSPESQVREVQNVSKRKISEPMLHPNMTFMEQRRYLDFQLLKKLKPHSNDTPDTSPGNTI